MLTLKCLDIRLISLSPAGFLIPLRFIRNDKPPQKERKKLAAAKPPLTSSRNIKRRVIPTARNEAGGISDYAILS